jgi:hypothetical protein
MENSAGCLASSQRTTFLDEMQKQIEDIDNRALSPLNTLNGILLKLRGERPSPDGPMEKQPTPIGQASLFNKQITDHRSVIDAIGQCVAEISTFI